MPNYGDTTQSNAGAPNYGGTVGNYYTPRQAAEVAASVAATEGFLSNLVSRDSAQDLLGGGKAGAPIFIRQPTTLVARSRAIDEINESIHMEQITERGVTLNLSRQMDYHAAPLDEADINLGITDFNRQVLRPQVQAVLALLEQRVQDALQSVDSTGEFSAPYDPIAPTRFFTALRKHLRDNGVPVAGLQVLVGTGVYADLLDADAITRVDMSGSPAALRDAQVGRVRGMNVVEHADLDDYEIVAFHRDAVVLATRAPMVPPGHAFGQTVSERGFSLRYLREYVPEKTVHRSYVATFSAVALMPTYKIERTADLVDVDKSTSDGTVVDTDHGGTVQIREIPNGGVVRLPNLEDLIDSGGDDGGVEG